jgi:tetratricopeptide (TPR) repeat protein
MEVSLPGTDLGITAAIIFSNRSAVRNAVREELKKCGIASGDIHNSRTLEEYNGAAETLNENFFLALDWEVGVDAILTVLEKNRAQYKIETRPTFLFAAALDEKIVAVAAEYCVSKVHTGEITGEKIREEIVKLVKEAKDLSAIKALYTQVETRRQAGDFDGAIQILEQLYGKFPTNQRVAVELADSYIEVNKWEEAEGLLKVVISADPAYVRARQLYARCCMKRGKADEAIDNLKDASILSPYNINRLAELGNILLEKKRTSEAKEVFGQILDVAPESQDGRTGKLSSMLLLGEVNDALSLLREASSGRELAAIFNNAAIMAVKNGDLNTAVSLYRTALDAIGDRPKVAARLYYNLGIGFCKFNKLNESLSSFKQAVKMDPSYGDAEHNIGVVQRIMNKPAKAAKVEAPKAEIKREDIEAIETATTDALIDSISFDTNLDSAFEEDDF